MATGGSAQMRGPAIGVGPKSDIGAHRGLDRGGLPVLLHEDAGGPVNVKSEDHCVFGFQSCASRWASAICAAVIFAATMARFLAAYLCPSAAARFHHMWACT